MNPTGTPRKYILTFLALTFITSAVFWHLIYRAGDMRAYGGMYTFGLMWCCHCVLLLEKAVIDRE